MNKRTAPSIQNIFVKRNIGRPKHGCAASYDPSLHKKWKISKYEAVFKLNIESR